MEAQWSEALAANNIRSIIFWLEESAAEGDAELKGTLSTFSCWIRRTSELTEKELETLCFSRCQGLWMFLDRTSFIKVHLLLQRLQNLFTLVQWARKQLYAFHLCHVVEVSCWDTHGSSDLRSNCWNQQHQSLKHHIWLGQLVQWWGIMGLLPKFPAQELKRICQMWKEMELIYLKTSLKTPGWNKDKLEQYSFLIEGMVMQLGGKHGCIWTSGGSTDRCYPPPNLQALLKLVLVPHADNMSIQAILMYFILDVVNFLQCKDDLLQSFCHAFTIPYSFSQQIRAFWMLDHGHLKESMELLLSPRASGPWLSWQHRCIICSLLTREEPHMALRYYQWMRPTIETIEDAKLCADVLLQCRWDSEVLASLKRSHKESNDMVVHVLQACEGLNLHAETLKYVPEECNGEGYFSRTEATILKQKMKDCLPSCPLSTKLYQHQKRSSVSTEELIQMFQKAVIEVKKPHPKISEVVWPKQARRKSKNQEIFPSYCHTSCSLNVVEETEQKQPETSEDVSSSENLSSISVSSLPSASSPPLLEHERTVTLQRISSLLIDQEIPSEDKEEEESRNSSSTDSFPGHPELFMTPDGTTEQVSFSSLDKEASTGLMGYSEGGEEVDTAFPDVDSSDGALGTFVLRKSEDQSDSFLISPGDQKELEHHPQEHLQATPTSLSRIDNRTSCLQRDSCTSRLFCSVAFTAKKINDEQAEKKEPAGWTEKTSLQGAIRSARTRCRKSKRVKNV